MQNDVQADVMRDNDLKCQLNLSDIMQSAINFLSSNRSVKTSRIILHDNIK